MKRPFQTVYAENEASGYEIGDQEAHRVAAALGDRADAPTLRAFHDMLTLLERVGGQFHVTAVRTEREDGEFNTVGLAFNYETRDARLKEAAAPDTVLGYPVTPSDSPPTEVDVEQHESSTAPSESTGGSSPEPDQEAAAAEEEQAADQEQAVGA